MGDNHKPQLEWTPLKGIPYEYHTELRLTRVSGNLSEFESRTGKRYRRIEENGKKQWFSFRTNQIMKRATRAQVKICCKKFDRSFGIFVDGHKGGPKVGVSIFPKNSGLSAQLSRLINFCPWCGKKIQFVGESEETGRPKVRIAAAGG